jgi:hypothetical protein
MIPDMRDVLEDVRRQYPKAWELCHKDYGHQDEPGRTTREQAELFIRIVAWECHRRDAKMGLLGKRGGDIISQDALVYRTDEVRRHGADVVAGAGGDNPSIVWNRYQEGTDATGKWIQPSEVSADTIRRLTGGHPTNDGIGKLSAEHQRLARRFAEHFGLPASGGDEAREWLRRLAEQFCATFPGSSFGVKSTRPGSPQSNNVLACMRDRLVGWRLLAESGPQRLDLDTDGIDIRDQAFISVNAVRHLPDDPPPADLGRVLEAVTALSSKCEGLTAEVRALKETLMQN